ncbi:MAG TPA: TlpA disulfide reductase family protein [Thermoanaerobaculia bacterium]|jgi:thiol-disulfide isomerase/thioredoxin
MKRAGRPALAGLLAAAVLGAATLPAGLSGELDAAGLASRIAQEKGRVVLVNFWATWCEPCREEFPSLSRLDAAYRSKGLTVLGVSTDLASQMPGVEKFLAAQKPSFPNYRKKSGGDDQVFIDAVDKSWGGDLPFTVLYARDGRKARVLAGQQSYAAFEKEIQSLLR